MAVAGRTRHLGYFDTAEAAAEAYAVAREALPPQVSRGTAGKAKPLSNAGIIRAAFDGGIAQEGSAVVLNGGQRYVTAGVVTKVALAGHEYVAQVWRARCRVCGEPFDFTTAGRPKGFVRTCQAHRALGPWRHPLGQQADALGCSVDVLREALECV